MSPMRWIPSWSPLAVALALAAACGGGDDPPENVTDDGDQDAAPPPPRPLPPTDDDDDGEVGLEAGELLPGGDTTTDNVGFAAFTLPAANLIPAHENVFQTGLQFFRLAWIAAPGTVEIDGLGPTFNADRCPVCHDSNGRGAVEQILLRLALEGGAPVPNYGGQLQDQAINGVLAEGRAVRHEVERRHVLADGSEISLLAPSYTIEEPQFGTLEGVHLSPRIGPLLVGQGLIEAIDEADIVAWADPDDRDGDGISGRAVYPGGQLGRFGWKAAQPTVTSQTAHAFSEDLGITSSALPEANCPPVQTDCAAAPNGGEPELSATRLQVTVQYLRLLGVPRRRDGDAANVLEGKRLFHAVGCTSCHRPSFVTTAKSAEVELHNQRIWPYSDFLVHDLGEGLADGVHEGDTSPREWRTAPLWSLGLARVVHGKLQLLHDGRASSVPEAIYWHDGEAREARLAFERLSAEERERLVEFVESL